MPEQEPMAAEIAALMDAASGDIAVGEVDAAVGKYRRCTELAPDFFDGWHAFGMALMKTGRHPEAIEAGLAKLVGTSAPAIVGEVECLLNDPIAYRAMAKGASPYGDGKASGRIVAAIAQRFGITA